ncbi:ATP-binding protein [Streptomyces sp. NPDC046324]|uniref:ATP-binding protein n=1 Tax=Streptomyces sp. NPDC046324 TaxID=3154915 RepID=UPI0033C57925
MCLHWPSLPQARTQARSRSVGRGDLTNGQSARLEPLLPQGVKPSRPPVWTRRQLLLRFAGLPERWTLNDFDFAAQPGVDEKLIRDLATLRFLDNASHVLLVGPPGAGKTMLEVNDLRRLRTGRFRRPAYRGRAAGSCRIRLAPVRLRGAASVLRPSPRRGRCPVGVPLPERPRGV